jgi:processive 1,2-diacylglycerol beta-glucosyltransferase
VTRVLILTASVGEGHDLPARTLASQLRAESPEVEVAIEDGLRAMGRAFVLVNERAPGVVFHRFQWLWDAAFLVFVKFRPTRRLTQALVRGVGSRGVLRLVQSVQPDVVVSVYPMTTEVLGGLRRRGQLAVPVVAAITDLAMMHYWAAPGIDLHIVTHPESIDEVRAIAGADAMVEAVHGLTRPEFGRPCDRAEARRVLELPTEGKVVLVSGGGWGVGDVIGAARIATEQANVVVLAGHNELLLDASPPAGVRILPFVDDMPTLLSAADVLVHSTAGLTILEALLVGCRPISYGWHTGHVRVNERAFERTGLARVARTESELRRAVAAALAEPRVPQAPRHASLPHAADLILELAGS